MILKCELCHSIFEHNVVTNRAKLCPRCVKIDHSQRGVVSKSKEDGQDNKMKLAWDYADVVV